MTPEELIAWHAHQIAFLPETDNVIVQHHRDAMHCVERLRAEVAASEKREMMALGFAYAWCCSLLDKARDPRNYEVPQMLADWDAALAKQEKEER